MKNPIKAGQILVHVRTKSKLGLREAARLAGTSHATFRAYETGSKIPSVDTFLRLVESCNYSLELTLLPRIRQSNGLSRGDELIEVLNLTDQFPSLPSKKLLFPKFPER